MSDILATMLVIIFCVIIFYVLSKLKIKKFGYLLLGIYVAILVFSVIIYQVLSVDEPPVESEQVEEPEMIDMYNVMYGEPIENYEHYKEEEWTFDVSGLDQLKVDNVGDSIYSIPIFIELIDEGDSVFAAFYENQPVVGNIEPMIENKSSIDLTLQDNQLSISVEGRSIYIYKKVIKEFIHTQFTEGIPERGFADIIYSGDRILYLKVPVNIELQFNDDIFFEYID